VRTTLKRYEIFGWDYERHNPLSEKEIAWYKRFALQTGGPVLELACGTGRLLVDLAKAGYEMEGIDLSPAMLRMTKERISQLPPEVQRRIQFHLVDMSNFLLKREFGLILIADNSFQALKLPEQRIGCLKSVCNHLRSDGKFLVTVRRFDPKRYVTERRDTPWSEPIPHPVTGNLVRRMVRLRLDEDKKWVYGLMTYKTVKADGEEKIEECPIEFPVMLVDDYIALFSTAGFSTTCFGGYEERRANEGDEYLCFVCEKR